ncbi:hypothetical protein BX661DRAFT_100152 [Kickxella alabastrina]|uniref:uncharacterized protein n=1 Tax=Kickxella alabastrina TaxID=61397 RepID=UPI00221FB579|nr:uncharacterized protein BX661DRAFT_100152 [Kickxella alabastrina]KAI7829120.1 hypothetical protein BX661DRAFT_100152 [Kickxella alabastrina]
MSLILLTLHLCFLLNMILAGLGRRRCGIVRVSLLLGFVCKVMEPVIQWDGQISTIGGNGVMPGHGFLVELVENLFSLVHLQKQKSSFLCGGFSKPIFLCKKTSSELAESASAATPETLPKPKTKRVRKNPSAPASSLQKKQRTD